MTDDECSAPFCLCEDAFDCAAMIACDHCDGTGECEEGCACYQCEYDDSRHRIVYDCPNCDGSGVVKKART